MVDVEIDDLAPPSLNDVVEYLKTTRNGLIGNPLNKLQLLNAHQDDGPPLLNRYGIRLRQYQSSRIEHISA